MKAHIKKENVEMRRVLNIGVILAFLLALVPAAGLAHTEDVPFDTPLIADGGSAATAIEVGVVKVWNDADYLYVKYEISDLDWCITKTHLHAATSLSDIPQTKNGNPIPGQFEYFESHDCETEVTYTIPLGEWNPGDSLAIAAHAVVSNAPVCSASSIVYGTERAIGSGGDIYEIDLVAGTASFVFGTGLNPANQNSPNGNAFDPVNDRLYYSSNDTEDVPSALYFYDFDGNQFTAGVADGFAAGAGFYSGEYYYVENRTDDLRAVSFNPDGTIQSDDLVLGDFTGKDEIFRFGDIVIRSDGILFGSAQVRDGSTDAILRNEFFKIVLPSGPYTQIATFPTSSGTRQLAFGSDATLYGHNAGTGEFFTIDPDTGLETSIGLVTGSNTDQFTDLASGTFCIPETETAWGTGSDFPGKNWATYFEYVVQAWNLTGDWILEFTNFRGVWPHDMTISSHDQVSGALAGDGGSPASGPPYNHQWYLTGTLAGDTVQFHLNYYVGPLAGNYWLDATGVIAPDGTMSGTYADNGYTNGNVPILGTWQTTSGAATWE